MSVDVGEVAHRPAMQVLERLRPPDVAVVDLAEHLRAQCP